MSALPKDELRDLYRELILDHAKHPRHFGEIEEPTHSAKGINPLCGDRLNLQLRLRDGMIADAGFHGSGCAISLASASLMTDHIIGLPAAAALEHANFVVAALSGKDKDGEATPVLGKLEALKGVRDYPSRVKCATLAWHALDAAVNARCETVRTE